MDKQTMIYTNAYNDDIIVTPVFDMYRNNNNLYVGLEEFDHKLKEWDSFCSVTINTIVDLPFLESAINMNYGGQAKINFLLKNGFGELPGCMVRSGRETYPIFRFSAEKLNDLDPIFFAAYAKVYGRALENVCALDNQIQKAKSFHKETSRSLLPSFSPNQIGKIDR